MDSLVGAGPKKRAILVPIFTPDFACQTILLHPLAPPNSYFATMVRKWVNESFKSILLDNCQAYLDSNDMGKHKTRTLLINEVAQKIRDAALGSDLPNDLNKVGDVEFQMNQESTYFVSQRITTWFGNEAKRVAGEGGQAATKPDKNGRKNNPGKRWNKRLVAAEIHRPRLNEIHKEKMEEYAGDGQAHLRTYSTAVSELIKELSPEELADCEELAELWNKEPVPQDVQQKSVAYLIIYK
jgi:hypothetical protein